MTTQTRFKIYYIDSIDSTNNLLNFREPNNPPASELTASLLVGSRSMTNLMTEVERALNDAGENIYSVTFDRTTRLVTISADDDFNLLVSSGSSIAASPFSLLGFTGSDRTGAASYVGDTAIGTSYVPQFLPQSFKSFDNNKEGIQSVINESAAGVIEVVTFGSKNMMEFNIFGATNNFKSKGNPIRYNPNGLDELNSLMQFLIKKSDVEFMIDEDVVSSFETIILDSTKKSRDGISYELNELLSRGLEGHFETGVLKFRKVDS